MADNYHEIWVPEEAKDIVIMHSSGMDSSMLIYSMVKTLQGNGRINDVNIHISTGDCKRTEPYNIRQSDIICKTIFSKITHYMMSF